MAYDSSPLAVALWPLNGSRERRIDDGNPMRASLMPAILLAVRPRWLAHPLAHEHKNPCNPHVQNGLESR